jgi:hypothetical protein
MTTLEKKIQKKVDEINNLISLASNSDSDNAYDGNLMVTDTSSTWEEPAIYKPIVFRNGVLYIEYFEPYSNRTKKDKILKRNLEFDGYGTLLDIAKIYRRALKKENIKYAGGGGVKINTEVILSENRPNGAEWRGVVKPFMLKSIEDNQYAGGFKRYEIDIYDEVDREPTKEEIKKANEFFDKIGGRYAGGGEFMTDPTFGNFQNNVYADGGGIEDAIKGYKEYTKKNWEGYDYFSEKYAVNELAELELDLRKLNDGRLAPRKVVGSGYKNAKKVAQEWLQSQIDKQKLAIKTNGLSNYTNHRNFRSYLVNAKRENMISERKFNELLDESNEIMDSLPKSFARGGEFMTYPTFGNFQNNIYADGGVTNNYVPRRNLNTITIKKGNQKLTYKISDVLNGAYKLESGAKLEDIAFYVPKRSIVKVQLKTGKDFKPANGYWIKDGAKPINISKFDEGGVMSRLLTRKKDQPKVETINEDIDLKEDSRIRVRPSSFVRKEKEGDWMMKYNSSKEARSYSGGGSIERKYNSMSKEAKEELMQEKIGVGRTPFNQYEKYNQLSDYHKKLVDKYFSGKLNYAGGGNVSKIYVVEYEVNGTKKKSEYLLYENDKVEKMLPSNAKIISIKQKMATGGKVTFSEKAKAIAKNFEGKRVEPKYQKEYGKVYDSKEAKEVGNKIAGSQKAKYDAKAEKGAEVSKGKGNHKMKATTDLARKIRKDGEKWTDAIKRASQQLK